MDLLYWIQRGVGEAIGGLLVVLAILLPFEAYLLIFAVLVPTSRRGWRAARARWEKVSRALWGRRRAGLRK